MDITIIKHITGSCAIKETWLIGMAGGKNYLVDDRQHSFWELMEEEHVIVLKSGEGQTVYLDTDAVISFHIG